MNNEINYNDFVNVNVDENNIVLGKNTSPRVIALGRILAKNGIDEQFLIEKVIKTILCKYLKCFMGNFVWAGTLSKNNIVD